MVCAEICFCSHGLGLLISSVTANEWEVPLSEHLYPMLKYFYSDASGLHQYDSTLSTRHKRTR